MSLRLDLWRKEFCELAWIAVGLGLPFPKCACPRCWIGLVEAVAREIEKR